MTVHGVREALAHLFGLVRHRAGLFLGESEILAGKADRQSRDSHHPRIDLGAE
jgi:hypothetical protein